MALIITEPLELYKVLFPGSITLAYAQEMLKKGAKFDSSYFQLRITTPDKKFYPEALAVSYSSLLKGIASPVETAQAKKKIGAFVEFVATEMGVVGSVKPASYPDDMKVMAPSVHPMSKSKIPVLDLHAFDAATPEFKKAVKVVEAQKEESQAVKLSKATFLGQKVKGTSTASIYRVVALNDRVKIAVAVKGVEISFRAEVNTPTNEELDSLKNILDWKAGGYASKHIAAMNIPAARIVGAVLWSLSIDFDQMVLGAKELQKALT